MLTAFVNLKIKPLGFFEVPVFIDGDEFISIACVTDSVSMSVDLILDTDILTQGDIHINKDGVSISKFNVIQNTDVLIMYV